MKKFEVLFTGKDGGWMKMLVIDSQDEVTAQQWADRQLQHWGRKKCAFKVNEVVPKPIPEPVKAEKPKTNRKGKK